MLRKNGQGYTKFGLGCVYCLRPLLVLNNPHNPTDIVHTKAELMEIARVCEKYNTYILADEIYALSTDRPEDFVSMGRIFPEGWVFLKRLNTRLQRCCTGSIPL